jgi:hypothetical protein
MMVAAVPPGVPVLGAAALLCGELGLEAVVLLPPHPAATSATVASGTARIQLRVPFRPGVCMRRAGISYPFALHAFPAPSEVLDPAFSWTGFYDCARSSVATGSLFGREGDTCQVWRW